MTELRELYQELIIDHAREPRNFGVLANASHQHDGFNPLCGDKLTVYLIEQDGTIADIHFEGSGCAISMASASLMTQALKGKTVAAAEQLFTLFQQLVTGKASSLAVDQLGKLKVLAGVAEFPVRVKCATLSWHTLKAAIAQTNTVASTE